MRRVIGWTWLAWLGASSVPVAAQADWLVLPTEHAGEEVGAAVLEKLTRALAQRSGAVLDGEEAGRRFRERASSEVAPPDQALVAEVESVVQALLEHVATRQGRLARRDIARLEQLVARSQASFDRDARAARALQNGCLHAVRVVLERGERERAKEEARRCITRFPGIEPDIHEHPPTIFGLLGEVRGELLAESLGSLRVDSAPRGCRVFLNGSDVGATPVDVPSLIPGEYRVQVECADRAPEGGRVHRAVVAAERKVLFVDTSLDRAVRAAPRLSLSYRDQREQDAQRVAHARAIARTLGVERVVFASVAGSGKVRLDRVDADGQRVVASVVLAVAPELVARFGDRTAVAIDAIVRGESLALDGETPAPLAPEPEPPAALPEPHPVAAAPRAAPPAPRPLEDRADDGSDLAPVGATLVTAGVLTLGATWVSWAMDATSPGVIMGTAAGGGLLAAVGMPLLLGPRRGVPWWAWTFGIVGTGLGVWAGWAIADHGRCEVHFASGECRDRVQSADAGLLLAGTAAPLLTAPFTYLLRPSPAGRSVQAYVDPGRGSTVLGMRGSF